MIRSVLPREARQVCDLPGVFDSEGLDRSAAQTESPSLRGIQLASGVDDAWGRSEGLDPDNVGDIADEGAGHRG
jgi:hypothetical protein